jgi:hypothetical protein
MITFTIILISNIRNEYALNFALSPVANEVQQAQNFLKKLDISSIYCGIGKKQTRTFFDSRIRTDRVPAGKNWIYPDMESRTAWKKTLIEKIQKRFPECKVGSRNEQSIEGMGIWRELISFEENIDGFSTLGNYVDIGVDYQSGNIISTTSQFRYKPLRQTNTSSSDQREKLIVERDGSFETAHKSKRWWPAEDLNPIEAKGDNANSLILLDIYSVKRNSVWSYYFFSPQGHMEKRPERHFNPTGFSVQPPPSSTKK